MTTCLEDILKSGYQTWKKNLKIGVPFLLSIIIYWILSRLFNFFTERILPQQSFAYPSLSSLAFQGGRLGSIIGSLILLLLAFIIYMIIWALISAFFSAGAIGMAKEATKKGTTKISDMVTYGKKKFISLFFSWVILLVIAMAGLILLVPATVAFLLNSIQLGSILLLIGLILAVIYWILLSLIFSPTSYAIVVGDLGAVDGIKNGYEFFMKNKLSVFLLLIFTIAISILIMLPVISLFLFIQVPIFFIQVPIIRTIITIIALIATYLLSAVIISALVTVWWTQLYLDRTERNSQVTSPAKRIPPITPAILEQQAIHI